MYIRNIFSAINTYIKNTNPKSIDIKDTNIKNIYIGGTSAGNANDINIIKGL